MPTDAKWPPAQEKQDDPPSDVRPSEEEPAGDSREEKRENAEKDKEDDGDDDDHQEEGEDEEDGDEEDVDDGGDYMAAFRRRLRKQSNLDDLFAYVEAACAGEYADELSAAAGSKDALIELAVRCRTAAAERACAQVPEGGAVILEGYECRNADITRMINSTFGTCKCWGRARCLPSGFVPCTCRNKVVKSPSWKVGGAYIRAGTFEGFPIYKNKGLKGDIPPGKQFVCTWQIPWTTKHRDRVDGNIPNIGLWQVQGKLQPEVEAAYCKIQAAGAGVIPEGVHEWNCFAGTKPDPKKPGETKNEFVQREIKIRVLRSPEHYRAWRYTQPFKPYDEYEGMNEAEREERMSQNRWTYLSITVSHFIGMYMIYSKTLCKVDQELCADNDEIPGYSGTFPHLWDKERDTFAHCPHEMGGPADVALGSARPLTECKMVTLLDLSRCPASLTWKASPLQTAPSVPLLGSAARSWRRRGPSRTCCHGSSPGR